MGIGESPEGVGGYYKTFEECISEAYLTELGDKISLNLDDSFSVPRDIVAGSVQFAACGIEAPLRYTIDRLTK